jgi:hypothetical protein
MYANAKHAESVLNILLDYPQNIQNIHRLHPFVRIGAPTPAAISNIEGSLPFRIILFHRAATV